MKTAYIYIRGLYTNQTQHNSIENQKNKCLEYARAKGYKVKDLFIDARKNGNDHDREELQRLFKTIKTDPPNVVICTSLDRLFRNIRDMSEMKNTLKKCGIKLIAVNQGGEITSDLVSNILASLAQYESEVAK